MELILHIGHEKTGTTSIQRSLILNKKILKEFGVEVPIEFGIGNSRAIPAMFSNNIDEFLELQGFNSLNYEEKQKSLLFELNEFLSKQVIKSKIIFSSEHFASRLKTVDELVKLKKCLDKHFVKITIIICIRNQAGMAESSYWERLKAGYATEIPIIPNTEIMNSTQYNYEKLLTMWSSVFSTEAIKIINYNDKVRNNESIVESFYRSVQTAFSIQIDMEKIKTVGVLNKSPGSKALNILRIINQCLIDEQPDITTKPYLYNSAFRSTVIKLLSQIDFNGDRIEVNRRRWQITFSESNKRVENLFQMDTKIFEEVENRSIPILESKQISLDGRTFASLCHLLYLSVIAERDSVIAERDDIANSTTWMLFEPYRRITVCLRTMNTVIKRR